MKKQLAFVLGGGGARGALQVGALRALIEAGYQPDLLVGTSAGAINATFMAVRGMSLQSITELVQAWHDAATAEFFPQNYLWLTVRALFRRPDVHTSHRLRDFFVSHGLGPELRFGDIQGIRLVLVATDLNASQLALYGLDPAEYVLEGLLASTALPPWVTPIERDGSLLMDGGAISTLPIEPAMLTGATEIIALDLYDPNSLPHEPNGFGPFLAKLLNTVERRQTEMELALASARRVPVHYLHLRAPDSVPLWDFSHAGELIEIGYELARAQIPRWQAESKPRFLKWLQGFIEGTIGP